MTARPRLTWDQKDNRRAARRAGLTAARYIASALSAQAEADRWAAVLGADDSQATRYVEQADYLQREAVRSAVYAGRAARLAEEAS